MSDVSLPFGRLSGNINYSRFSSIERKKERKKERKIQ
jgi:hypothetical protein